MIYTSEQIFQDSIIDIILNKELLKKNNINTVI